MMNLRTLLEKTADADFVREMIKFAAQRLMELDVEALTGSAHGVRNPSRMTQRVNRRGKRTPFSG
jgi:putative transposase